MLLQLKSVFTQEEPISFEYNFDISLLELNGCFPFVSPVKVKGNVASSAGAALLTAETSFEFSIPCDRCAEQINRRYTFTFHHPLVLTLNNEENDSFIEVKEYKLDLDELLRSDILLELPMKFLCKPDCKGLCEKCGKNRNNDSCSCDLRQMDPRMEILKKLID